MRFFTKLVGVALAIATPSAFAASPADELESHLVKGRLSEAREAMGLRLERDENDSAAQYALGIVDTLRAVEKLAQNLHRFGLKPANPQIPFVRLPVPENPNPEELSYEKWRGVLQEFIDDLEQAEETLAKVNNDDVKLKLPVGLIRLDLNGDGKASEEETFWRVFTAVAWRAAKLDEDQKRFEIGFDKADAHWMIGYLHLLRAMAEAWLAHDTSDFFDQTAPFFFDGASSPVMPFESHETRGFSRERIADLVAAIHLIRFDVVEPQRMQAAREHLLEMIAQSRKVWRYATSETDDDREWIPNANQTSLTPLTVNEARIEGWRQFLDEAEAVLDGKKLLPHWRVRDGRGINLKRVFSEPRRFDLVLWAHGAAAIPYLEKGEVVSGETAATLNRTFQGRFVVFAIWFQ